MSRLRAITLCMTLACWLALPAAAQVMHVYKVKHRTAEELLPLAETALAGEGRAIADPRTNSLVLTGSREAVQSALALFATLDVRVQTVVLRYESRGSADLAAQGARVAWGVDAGDVRIGNVAWPGGGTRVAVAVDDTARQQTGSLAGQLRILSGESGRISTGTSAPITSRRVQPGRFGAIVHESTQYVSADSGFEARPRVLRDGRIELVLRPFDASLAADGRITSSSAQTVVMLEPGRTVAIGGILRDASGTNASSVSGAGASRSADQSLLLITATLE